MSGTAVLDELMANAWPPQVSTCVEHRYLAVMADNHTARRLYERAGFRTTHEYCYFAA